MSIYYNYKNQLLIYLEISIAIYTIYNPGLHTYIKVLPTIDRSIYLAIFQYLLYIQYNLLPLYYLLVIILPAFSYNKAYIITPINYL